MQNCSRLTVDPEESESRRALKGAIPIAFSKIEGSAQKCIAAATSTAEVCELTIAGSQTDVQLQRALKVIYLFLNSFKCLKLICISISKVSKGQPKSLNSPLSELLSRNAGDCRQSQNEQYEDDEVESH